MSRKCQRTSRWCAGLLALGLSLGAGSAESDSSTDPAEADAQLERRFMARAEQFFGDVSEGVGSAIERAFDKYGVPTAYITGEELGAAHIGGVRYGRGVLHMTDGDGQTVTRMVYWQGPSAGLDSGANASKVFMLVYNLREAQDIFRRVPLIDGGLYLGGGGDLGVQNRARITIVPVRSGVGVRVGARLGYLNITRQRRWLPL